MAELVLAPVTEKLIEKVIEKIIDACFEYLKDQARWQRDMKKELQNLLNILPQIQAVVSAHSQVEIKDEALNKWYWQLRDAIDEADDVLDEIEYKKLQKQAIKNKKTEKVRSFVKSIKKKVVVIIKRALKIDAHLKKLEMAVLKLNEISTEVSKFLHLVDSTKKEQQKQRLQLLRTRETGAILGNDFVGRSKEIEFVSQWLRNSYEMQSSDTADLYRNISVLSVVGHGGMGKTTLLQHVYDKDVTTLFDVKMWVCVSTNFDAKTVIKNILESVENRRPDQDSLHSLQTSLRSKVTSKKFLLVLDDIWEEGNGKWENVLSPLQYGSYGSKILISTRILSVASTFANMIKNNQMFKLEGLEKDSSLQLFNKYAFAGRGNPDGNFTNIAKKIVKKLSHCPLAVKFIANFLNTCVEEAFWTNVLNTSIANIKSGENGLLAILKLSYTHLPNHLQNCFSFCCIFPQDHEFDKDDLVRMWVAVGFIQSPDIPEETLENTGRRYFDILVRNSFFDEFHTYDYQVYYKMHDLLHELAQSISKQECSRVVDDKKLSIPVTIRHLSIDAPSLEILKEIKKLKHLRSLVLSFSEVGEFDENLISQILKASKSLRLLAIYPPTDFNKSPDDYNMPETINCLNHLRYLKAEYGVLKLSTSISHLYHLQFVISKRPNNLVMDKNIGWEELRPNKNCHLITDKLVIEDLNSVLVMEPQRSISYLRSLIIQNSNNLVSIPTETEAWFLQHRSTLIRLEFHMLQSLQFLPSFSTFSSLTWLELTFLRGLKSLPDLPSSLIFLRLAHLHSLDCLPSSLSAITSPETLNLEEIPLLKSLLYLPSSLKELRILRLESLQNLSSSFSNVSSLHYLNLFSVPLLESLPELPSSLTKLHVHRLKSLERLPSSLSDISSLQTIELTDIPLLKSLPNLPSSLKMLDLYNLESLQCPSFSLSAISNSFETLKLSRIPLLKSLPALPSSLKKLYLYDLKSLQLPSSLSAISSLKTLELKAIPLLKSLPDLPSSLKELELANLKSLYFLSAISSLKTLKLKAIPLLKSLPDLPSSLTHLYLINLEKLDCLPSFLPNRLNELRIEKAPLLLELPDLPASLNDLDIEDCDPHLMARCESFRRRFLKKNKKF